MYINAQGRLFWNLKIFSLRNLNRHISTFDIVTILIRRYRYIYLDHSFLKCVVLKIFCFWCWLWLGIRFQRLVCWLVLKGLVPSHSAEFYDFSRCGIINNWKNFDQHNKGLWTRICELESTLSGQTIFYNLEYIGKYIRQFSIIHFWKLE